MRGSCACWAERSEGRREGQPDKHTILDLYPPITHASSWRWYIDIPHPHHSAWETIEHFSASFAPDERARKEQLCTSLLLLDKLLGKVGDLGQVLSEEDRALDEVGAVKLLVDLRKQAVRLGSRVAVAKLTEWAPSSPRPIGNSMTEVPRASAKVKVMLKMVQSELAQVSGLAAPSAYGIEPPSRV